MKYCDKYPNKVSEVKCSKSTEFFLSFGIDKFFFPGLLALRLLHVLDRLSLSHYETFFYHGNIPCSEVYFSEVKLITPIISCLAISFISLFIKGYNFSHFLSF